MDNPPEHVAPATVGLTAELASRLSRDHRREIADTSGLPPEAALGLSLASSVEAYCLVEPGDGRAVFAMGVEERSPLTGGAMVWMLGSDLAVRRPAAVLRAARWGVARAFAITGAVRLEQYIPEWYGTGILFARRLGFVAVPPSALGRNGAQLLRMVRYPDERREKAWDR